MEHLKQILKFKYQHPLQQMAKSTGIEELINFCEIIDDMDQFEQPNYLLLQKVLKSESYDTS